MPPRRQVLGFVARRLLAESVAIVFAVREPTDDRELAGAARASRSGARRRGRARPARPPSSPAGSTSASATGSSPRRAATRSRSWSCRAASRPRRSWPAAFGLPDARGAAGADRGELPAAARARCPDETRLLLLVAAAEPVGDPLLLWRAASGSGIAGHGARRRRPTGLLDVGERVRFRHPLVRSAVYRSASDARAPGGAPRAGRGDRRRSRAGPPRVASRRRRAGPRRGGRGRARAVRRPGAGARRARRRGGVPAAARSALTLDPAPARRARAGRGAGLACRPARSTRRSALLAAAEAEPLDELGRARVDLLHAEVAFAQNRGSDAPPLLLRAARQLEPLDARLSRDTYLDAWSAALFAGRLATAGDLLDVSRAVSTGPAAAALAAPVRPAAGRLRARVHRRARRPRHRCCSEAADGVRRARASGGGGAALGLAGHGGGRVRLGLRHLPRGRDPRGRSSRATPARSRSSPSRVNVLGQAVALGGDFARGGAADRRGRRGHRGHRDAASPRTARSCSRALRGREAEASAADRSDDRGGHRPRPGHRGPVRALGQRGAA